MKETHQRSIAKTISWRIIATLTTAVLVFSFTGSFEIAVGVGALEVVLKLLFYYLHERTWASVGWGNKTA
jgi:adenylylsulfate kinase